MSVATPTDTKAWPVDARSLAGRLALVVVFTALLAVRGGSRWWQTGLVLALTSAFPQHRKRLLVLAALCWVYLDRPVNSHLLRELLPAQEQPARLLTR